MKELHFKIADNADEFDAIHQLNYRTFVEEIPQHSPNPERRLIDAFHAENTYAICLDANRVVGMVTGRSKRPFSLDRKLDKLDSMLPHHNSPLEIRLLSVEPAYRKSRVFIGLVTTLIKHFAVLEHDLVLISGTVRQLKLYRSLGFTPFGNLVGSAEACYQPMYLNIKTANETFSRVERVMKRNSANFTTGPVATTSAVTAAFHRPAISHRGDVFLQLHQQTCQKLCELFTCDSAYLMMGSGTLANDAVGAQISALQTSGIVISNGEFGERLIDHAKRWRLEFTEKRFGWGEPIDLKAVEIHLALQSHSSWVWMVVSETSTGMLNQYAEVAELCKRYDAKLYLDAISAAGTLPLDLSGAKLATAVSGKALGALSGVAIVMANGKLATSANLPRYLDLENYAVACGVPYTQSSHLISALAEALKIDWPSRYLHLLREGQRLRSQLEKRGFNLVCPENCATPAVVTIALPGNIRSSELGASLSRMNLKLSWESSYLLQRNWIQICLMGDFNEFVLHEIPLILEKEVTSFHAMRLRKT